MNAMDLLVGFGSVKDSYVIGTEEFRQGKQKSQIKRPSTRKALLIAALIGFSRLYLGVHYPSDVLGGFLIALIISYIVNKKGSEYYGRNRN